MRLSVGLGLAGPLKTNGHMGSFYIEHLSVVANGRLENKERFYFNSRVRGRPSNGAANGSVLCQNHIGIGTGAIYKGWIWFWLLPGTYFMV